MSTSLSTPEPVAYHPTTSNVGNTCLYLAIWSERYEASNPGASVAASRVVATSKDVQISTSRVPV